jgi:hypothetical protein
MKAGTGWKYFSMNLPETKLEGYENDLLSEN